MLTVIFLCVLGVFLFCKYSTEFKLKYLALGQKDFKRIMVQNTKDEDFLVVYSEGLETYYMKVSRVKEEDTRLLQGMGFTKRVLK